MSPSPDALVAFAEVSLISKSSAPLLMLHGDADQLVPIKQGKEVFTASPALQKQFINVPGAGHNDTVESSAALGSIHFFLNTVETKAGSQ